MRPGRGAALTALLLLGAGMAAGRVFAADERPGLSISASVDKTTVTAGTPVTLTVTVSGDLSGAQLPTPSFPDGFQVAATSQATNVSVRPGALERSTNLAYVLVPTREGTFQLGPFSIKQKNKTTSTEPISVTVEKSPLPPTLKPGGERFTI